MQSTTTLPDTTNHVLKVALYQAIPRIPGFPAPDPGLSPSPIWASTSVHSTERRACSSCHLTYPPLEAGHQPRGDLTCHTAQALLQTEVSLAAVVLAIALFLPCHMPKTFSHHGNFFHCGYKNKLSNVYILPWLNRPKELSFTNFKWLTMCFAPQ